jgi:hypothetical protein
MSQTAASPQHRRGRPVLRMFRHVLAGALAVALLGAVASEASATTVRVVSKTKSGPNIYSTIQDAVNATTTGDYVLIEPGVYDEAVEVTKEHSGIWVRGLNRNKVIIDGQNKAGNGIDIHQANNVWVENLTVRNFDTGPDCPVEECGNEIWWDGAANSNSSNVEAHGWYGSYLTAYNTGLNGGYGLFTSHETEGSWNNIYASGFNDSGMYIGACQECDAHVSNAVMENNSLGYSGSNSGGKLVIEKSIFRRNSTGVVPNSEAPGDKPPPQDGECGRPNIENPNPEPIITTTKLERCTVFRNNRIIENNNSTVPVNDSTERASFGNGIILPGTYADLVERNVITNNEKTGLFGIELPVDQFVFQVAGNRISNNVFAHNGSKGGPFTGDITLGSGFLELFGGESQSKNNCVSANVLPDATFPAKIQGTWGCQHETTPNPGGAPGIYEYIAQVEAETPAERKPVGQPAPPPQPTMPNPCRGLASNALCP